MTLDELQAAAERVVCEYSHKPPCSCAGDWSSPDDVLALATFVRDLLGRKVAADVPDEVNAKFRDQISILGYVVSQDDALDIATCILRAVEQAREKQERAGASTNPTKGEL